MDHDTIKGKLGGAGLGMLEGVDPNVENFVCAGVMHTTTAQIGCLIRLEPNVHAQMYRLTVRASKEGLSKRLCDLMEVQL